MSPLLRGALDDQLRRVEAEIVQLKRTLNAQATVWSIQDKVRVRLLKGKATAIRREIAKTHKATLRCQPDQL